MLIGFWKELVIVIIIDYWKAVIATTLIDTVLHITLLSYVCGYHSLVPRPSTPPVVDRSSMKNGGRRPGESSHVIHGMTVIYRHASYQQSKSCTRPILHSSLATKMGQTATVRMKRTQATRLDSKRRAARCRVTSMKKPSYDAIFSWSEKTALFGVSPLVSQLSLSGFAWNLDRFYR